MLVHVKTTGLLGKHLPEGSARNNADIELPDNSNIESLVAQLAVPLDECLVTLNGTLLQQPDYATSALNDGDRVVIMEHLAAG